MLKRDGSVKWIIGGFLLLMTFAAIGTIYNLMQPKVKVQVGGQLLSVRVADSDAERAHGLSGTKVLGEKEAMLFVFDQADKWGIWMKDMQFSIDIIWLDDSKKIVDVAQHVSPDTYPNTFRPKVPALYVLEVPAGFVDRYQIGPGTSTAFYGL